MGRACNTNLGGLHALYWWESQKGRRLLGRPGLMWVDNIKIYLR
jgi:hypothetical protein